MPDFPFTAIVGQPLFKLALVLATINRAIGGVLVSGPRGSAKSTLARSLADITPSDENGSCPFVTLPLGTTEEMLVGTLNLQKVLTEQSVTFQEGLLAKADGGVLYIDEVNLLQDNLVDLLLDVAASGINRIERDGVSRSHRSRFLLMGTMNPDEGELRPQLHDRFGLSVKLSSQYSLQDRIAIVRRREAFDADPHAFIAEHREQQAALQVRLIKARNVLPAIVCDYKWRMAIAERCQQAMVEGVRADIVWYRAAVAHAAWRLSASHSDQGREGTDGVCVTEQDVCAVEGLVLAHRRQAFAADQPPQKPFSRPLEKQQHNATTTADQAQQSPADKPQGDWGQMQARQQTTSTDQVDVRLQKILRSSGNNIRTATRPPLAPAVVSANTAVIGSKGKTGAANGRTVDWFASLIASAGDRLPAVTGRLTKLCYRRARLGQPVLQLIALDTSASTLQNKSFSRAKAMVLAVAEHAYLQRQQLIILGFGNQQVQTLLPQKKASRNLRRWLDTLKAGGGTPLRNLFDQVLCSQQKILRHSPETAICTWLITDGKTTQTFQDKQLLGNVMVIDIEHSAIKRGKAREIAEIFGAHYFPLPLQ